ncbi:Bacterial conjugation TrbI-like protein [mine drainage metagenome]|uniref:Bacterial conjugation TrbI-like protein n=2 Tax=mine drainage metagenome TaxID=410659 RepID=T1C3V6_9ZZZZ
MPGSVIPAVLVSEIDSDLPGMVVARVTRTVDDSVHEYEPMIPMGSTLVGYYSSDVSQGQTRVLASFSEIIFPDGRRVPLAGMAAADAYGASGLKDEVRTHFWKIFGSSFLIAALSSFLPADQSGIVLTPGVSSGALIGSAAGQALVGTSQAILERNQNIPPTLVIRPGFRFLVMVNRPITLSEQSG